MAKQASMKLLLLGLGETLQAGSVALCLPWPNCLASYSCSNNFEPYKGLVCIHMRACGNSLLGQQNVKADHRQIFGRQND